MTSLRDSSLTEHFPLEMESHNFKRLLNDSGGRNVPPSLSHADTGRLAHCALRDHGRGRSGGGRRVAVVETQKFNNARAGGRTK